MEEYEKYLIIYGYVLPMAIMLVWIMWRVCSDLKAGERYVSRFIRDCWPMLIPGVSLWGVCSLLLLASVECSHWLERHWGVWRMAGEQSRSIARRMLGGRQKECPNHQPLIKAEMLKRMEAEEAKKDTLGDVPPPQRYTEKIQVGDNVTNIIQLPCVQSAHKRSGKDRKVAYYILEPSAMSDSEHWQYAHPGEWLVQDENGKWHVTKE